MTDQEAIALVEPLIRDVAERILQDLDVQDYGYLADLIPDMVDLRQFDETEERAYKQLKWSDRRDLCKKIASEYFVKKD